VGRRRRHPKKVHDISLHTLPDTLEELFEHCIVVEKVRFNKAGISQLPDDKPGLYSFVVHPNVGGHEAIAFLLYIGEATKQTLQSRCSDYLPESKKKKARVPIRSMVLKWPDNLWIYFSPVDDVSTIKQLEEDLVKAYIPPFNQMFTAQVGKAGKLSEILKEVFQ
jgi:hypothetical protein